MTSTTGYQDTTAGGTAPDARAIGARREEDELQEVLTSIRRRKGTDLAEAATASRGDVTRVTGYQNLVMCLTQLRALEASYGNGSMGAGLSAAGDALSALMTHRATFREAFSPEGSESVRYIYIGAVMALWGVVTLLCAEAVEYVPRGNGGTLMPHVKSDGAGAVANSILATRLMKFVATANGSGFDRAMKAAAEQERALQEGFWRDGLELAGKIAGSNEGLGLAASLAARVVGANVASSALAGGLMLASGIGLALTVGSVVLTCLLSSRDIVAWFYRKRSSTASWLETQAAFLEMNAAALDPSKRVPREKQEQYARTLRALAARVKVDAAEAEREAAADIRSDDKALQGPAGPSGGAPRLI